MPNPQPLGEELWLRRDLKNRGGPFIFRELFVICILLWQASLLLLIPVFVILFQTSDRATPLAIAVGTVIVLIPAYISFFFLVYILLAMSRFSPIWFYAEQLNPEQLKVYHFRKPPTIIKLANSSLDTKKTKIKYYTTLTVTDKATETSATLGLLTPEEYDRFMQYWNAAQVDTDA